MAPADSKTRGSPLAILEREVAAALCQHAISGGSWPNKAIIDRVQTEWRDYLPAARVAIRAIGEAFIKGVGNGE